MNPAAPVLRQPARPPWQAFGALSRLALMGLLGSLALAAGCAREPPQAETVRAVRTVKVDAQAGEALREFAAEIRARSEVALAFQVPGRLLRRHVEVGDAVRAGQLLAEIDPQDLALAQHAAQAALQAAEVQATQAAADLARFEGLRAQGFVSEAELERRRSAARAAEAQRAQAQAQARAQGNQAAYSRLAAPAAGIVTAVLAEPGSVLAAGMPALRLALAGPRDAVFVVPEDAVDALRALRGRAGAAELRLWGDDAWLPATLREVAAAADPGTRAFQVKAELGDARVELGQTATLRLRTPAAAAGVRLPLTALREHAGGSAVWLLDAATMTVRLQPVGVAGIDGEQAIVVAGLAPGAEVVTAGVHVLTEGQKVSRWGDDAPPAAPR